MRTGVILENDKSMSAQIVALRVASAVFGMMCLAQLTRMLIFPQLEVLVGGYHMPLWPSAAAAILAGLSFWMWKASYYARK